MKPTSFTVQITPCALTGLAIISVGVLFNEWTLAVFQSINDGDLSIYSRYVIWVLDLGLIFAGSILIIQKDWRLMRWGGVGILFVAIIPLLVGYMLRMRYLFQIDFNEGWNVYHSIEAISGQLLYAEHLTWVPVNYPPLSLYLVGGVGKLIGNPLLAGRAISLLSLLLLSVGSAIIVRQLNGNDFAVIFSGVFCLGVFVTYARGYIAMNDPQLLGHVFVLMGLILYLKSRSGLFLTALLCCLGLFTKHNLFPIPLAISVDIFLRSRRDFFQWATYCAIIATLLFLVTSLTLGSEFIYHLTAPRGFDSQKVVLYLNRLGKAIVFSFLLTIPWLLQAMKDESSRIIPLYLTISILWGLFTSGGAGTDVNVFFDFFIGLSVAAGMFFLYIRSKFKHLDQRLPLISILLPMILGTGILIQAPERIPRASTFYWYGIQEQAFMENVAYLSLKPSPVICSNILLCNQAGHPFVFDPFLATENILSGRLNEDEVLEKLEEGYYQVIQLDYPIPEQYFEGQSYTTPQRSAMMYTENFLRAIGNNYYLAHETQFGVFYEPRK